VEEAVVKNLHSSLGEQRTWENNTGTHREKESDREKKPVRHEEIMLGTSSG
jgi:hypothetical protein